MRGPLKRGHLKNPLETGQIKLPSQRGRTERPGPHPQTLLRFALSESMTHIATWHNWVNFRRGDDTVGNSHRAQTSQFELFELILALKLDKQFPVEQFQATVS